MKLPQEFSVVIFGAPKGGGVITSHLTGVNGSTDASLPHTQRFSDPASSFYVTLTSAPLKDKIQGLLIDLVKTAQVVICCTPLSHIASSQGLSAIFPFKWLSNTFEQLYAFNYQQMEHNKCYDAIAAELEQQAEGVQDHHFSHAGLQKLFEPDIQLYKFLKEYRNAKGQRWLRVWACIDDPTLQLNDRANAIKRLQEEAVHSHADIILLYNSVQKSCIILSGKEANPASQSDFLALPNLLHLWSNIQIPETAERDADDTSVAMTELSSAPVLKPWQDPNFFMQHFSGITFLAVGSPQSGKSEALKTIFGHRKAKSLYASTANVAYNAMVTAHDGHFLTFRFLECPRHLESQHFQRLATHADIVAYFISAQELKKGHSSELLRFKQQSETLASQNNNSAQLAVLQQFAVMQANTTPEEFRIFERMKQEKLAQVTKFAQVRKKIFMLVITQTDKALSQAELEYVYQQFPFMLCCIMPQFDAVALQKRFLSDLAQWYYQHPIGRERPINRPIPVKPPAVAPRYFGVAFAIGGIAGLFIVPGLSQMVGISALVHAGANTLHQLLPILNPVLSFFLVKALACLLIAVLVFVVVVAAVQMLYWVDKQWRDYQARRSLEAIPQQYEFFEPYENHWKSSSLAPAPLQEVVIDSPLSSNPSVACQA